MIEERNKSRSERLHRFDLAGGIIRDLDQSSTEEVELVAKRMQLTLIEVLGDEKGKSMYSMEWLVQRVLFHLSAQTTGKVLVCEDSKHEICGHAIGRLERDENGDFYGFFSTIFVDSNSRRSGVATALMNALETWFRTFAVRKIVYNTAESNAKLIRLFESEGYAITLRESEMVELTKQLWT